MKAIIVDDEPKSREVLKTLLGLYCPSVSILGMASGVDEAKKMLAELNPNLVFLDVEMPGGNGFRLLNEAETKDFEVIFVTSYGHYAIPALRYSATDYLLKPVEVEELKAAVERAGERIHSGKSSKLVYRLLTNNLDQPPQLQKLAIHGVNEIRFAVLNEIVRMEGDSNYTYIYTSSGEKFHSSRTLKDYENVLVSYPNFIRVHKTHLINIEHITSFVKTDGGHVVMSDHSKVEVSRRKKQELIDRLGL